jgi:hypothetical protein
MFSTCTNVMHFDVVDSLSFSFPFPPPPSSILWIHYGQQILTTVFFFFIILQWTCIAFVIRKHT